MEEFPTEEQPQEEVTSENIKDFITSKTIKKRIAAYLNIESYPEFIGLLQNETIAIALEPALNALINYQGTLTNNEISKLFLQFTQVKATIKSLLSNLIDKVFEHDKINVVRGLLQNFTHKNTKIVLGCVSKLRMLIENNTEYFNSSEGKDFIVTDVCPQLESIFLSADKDVKTEGSTLVFDIYKIIFDLTLKFLDNVKPIILKDLKEMFTTIPIPNRTIKITDQPFDSTDWKQRLLALDFLKENIEHMSNKSETFPILFRKTKDQNINVVTAAIECIKRGKIGNQDCIKGAIARFKDKKAPLTLLIKESIKIILPDINLLIDSLDIKNPEIKLGVLECLKFYEAVPRAKEIAKLIEDASSDVRKLALEVLGNSESLEGLTEAQMQKLKKPVTVVPVQKKAFSARDTLTSNNSSPRSSNRTQSIIKAEAAPASSSLQHPDVEMYISSDFDFNLDQPSKNRIADGFIDKFNFLLEKDWARKLESIERSIEMIKEEPPITIILYLISSRETNFHIFKAFLAILETYNDLSLAKTALISFLNSKITETKLRDKILALYIKLDGNFVTQNFIYCLKSNKTGKKFLTFIEFFSLILKYKKFLVDQFLSDFKVIGAQEKKALAAFIDFYQKLEYQSEQSFLKDQENIAKTAECNIEPNNIRPNNVNSTNKEVLLNTNVYKGGDNPNDVSTTTVFIAQINQNRMKSCQFTLEKTFTNDFLQLFKTDNKKGTQILEKLDVIKHSDLVIGLYCSYEIQSIYFSELIKHFISKKYILEESEAIYLVEHLIKNSMDDELQLLDRIYPATKLYKIFRLISGEKSIKAIFFLIHKYKDIKDLKINEVERCVTENEDFIGFSLEIGKTVQMKEDLKRRYENFDNGDVTDQHSQSFYKKNIYNTKNNLENPTDIVKSISNHGKRSSYDIKQKDEDSLVCINNNEDASDINDIEDSIIEEHTPIVNINVINPTNVMASVIVAPSVSEYSKEHTITQTDELDVLNMNDTSFDIPEALVDTREIFNQKIEDSLENISISTTPQKKKRHFDQVENLLEKISGDSWVESKAGLEGICNLIVKEISLLLPSCNKIIGIVLTQLLTRYDNLEQRSFVLNILLKLTQNTELSSSMKYETLVSVNSSLIPKVKDDTLIADILINLCLNCDLQILRVYFDLLNSSDDILMKLIWRHSKRVNYSSPESAAVIVRIIDTFFQSKKVFLASSENIVIKVCLLHLKESVSVFSDNIKQFGIGETTSAIVNLLITSKGLNLEELRLIFRE